MIPWQGILCFDKKNWMEESILSQNDPVNENSIHNPTSSWPENSLFFDRNGNKLNNVLGSPNV